MSTKHLTNPVTFTIELDDLGWLHNFLTEESLHAEIDHEEVERLHTNVAIRTVIAKAYTDAVAAFDQNAAVDMAYLLDRVDELQDAIAVAASDLADVASYVAARYAGTPDEASEIRLAIGEPIDALVNVSQGTPITPEEAGE